MTVSVDEIKYLKCTLDNTHIMHYIVGTSCKICMYKMCIVYTVRDCQVTAQSTAKF